MKLVKKVITGGWFNLFSGALVLSVLMIDSERGAWQCAMLFLGIMNLGVFLNDTINKNK